MSNWLKYESPHYASMSAKWQRTHTLYTGEGAGSLLVQHRQGESDQSFRERVQLASFLPYTATVIDSLVGALFEKEAAIERDWGFMGDPDTPGTTAYHLSRDIDGSGMNYSTMLRRAATDLIVFNELFVLVDGERVRLLSPLSVPNYLEQSGRLTAGLVKEVVDGRTSIFSEPESVEQYVLYTAQGWTRWQDRQGTPVQVASGLYSESGRLYAGRDGEPMPPLVRITLPWRRYVAYALAENHRALFNSESDRDALVRAASYPKLVLSGDDQFFSEQVENLKRGSNVLQRLSEFGDHSYIAPPVEGIEAANATLETKQRAFYQAGWDIISAEGQVQKTATQAALERSAGLAGALAMIAATMEELDGQILWLLAQSVSDREAAWASVSADWGAIDFASVTVETPQVASGGAPSGE